MNEFEFAVFDRLQKKLLAKKPNPLITYFLLAALNPFSRDILLEKLVQVTLDLFFQMIRRKVFNQRIDPG